MLQCRHNTCNTALSQSSQACINKHTSWVSALQLNLLCCISLPPRHSML